jgi:peptidoglycan/xylan/chitin deacetylase (PgdA/CDA1 family)
VNLFWKKGASLVSEMAARSGITRRLLERRRKVGDYRVFILEYHDVAAGGSEPEGTVSQERFHRQLRFLRDHCRLVSLTRAVELLRTPAPLTEDLAVVTFDDGTRGNYDAAWPVLKEEGIPASIFVTSGFVDGTDLWFDLARRCFTAMKGQELPGKLESELSAAIGFRPAQGETDKAVERLKRLPPDTRTALLDQMKAAFPPGPSSRPPLTWSQLREMRADGVEVGCHTVSHPILSTLPAEQQRSEILGARERIAQELGEAPVLFAYPNGAAGDFTDATAGILRNAGFLAACTTVRGSNRPGCDLFRLKRIGVGADTEPLLAARLAGFFDEALRAHLPGAA